MVHDNRLATLGSIAIYLDVNHLKQNLNDKIGTDGNILPVLPFQHRDSRSHNSSGTKSGGERGHEPVCTYSLELIAIPQDDEQCAK